MPRILIVDDDPALREVVRHALEGAGHDILEADDGSTAVELARAQVPDLIVCDVRMEKMDGYRTLAALRQHSVTASIPFILMTGHADALGMRQGMELGADDYLSKPFTMPQLFGAVDARLKKHQTLREHAERKLADLRANISLALPHELLTPLNGILGFSDILIADHKHLSPREIVSMSEAIRDSARRLHRLIENFLIFVQMELRPKEHVASLSEGKTLALRPVVERVIAERARQAGRDADVFLDLEEVTAKISEEYFAKIVDELADNAFKFSTPDSTVRISLRRAGPAAQLRIADRGRGMRAEYVAEIGAYMQFERRFYEQQGSGLGLTVAKRLAELHGGSLTITSAVGAGTTVEVRLPSPEPSGSVGVEAEAVLPG